MQSWRYGILKGKVKKKQHEKLTASNIKHVISLLEGSPPITKKEACEILNISYNTTRLNKIIEDYREEKERQAKMRAQKRGKPATDAEIATIVESYLEGDSIVDISKRVYRSAAFVKNIIETLGVPSRVTGEDKHKPEILPDACVAEEFNIGEIAWSATYHAPCEVRQKLDEKYNDRYGANCYRVWIREKTTQDSPFFGHIEGGGYNAYVPAYELGKLSHLEKYGVRTDRL